MTSQEKAFKDNIAIVYHWKTNYTATKFRSDPYEELENYADSFAMEMLRTRYE